MARSLGTVAPAVRTPRCPHSKQEDRLANAYKMMEAAATPVAVVVKTVATYARICLLLLSNIWVVCVCIMCVCAS